MKSFRWIGISTIALASAVGFQCLAGQQLPAGESQIAVKFSGGHDTDRRDGGRPIILVASALGVSADVFRTAFSGVTPARGGEPDPEQVHRNKDALLSVLAPYGITNDRLDEVSNYYRYRPQDGELWRNTPAEAYAIVSHGKIVGFKITRAGSGYSSTPKIIVPGFESTQITTKVAYSTNLKTNGSILNIGIAPRPAKK